MKFYITVENNIRLKRSFLNLKIFSIISVSDILEEYGYTYNTIDEYGSFIVSKKILSLIQSYSKSKRIRGIIYSNQQLNENSLKILLDTLKENKNISNVVLLDDYNMPKLKHLYKFFDEIIFFPSVKKIRLIECKPIEELIKNR